ncbi:MAG: DUF1385 domain-containing protein [Bacteroidetes bacterium]|nr:DUF1385 domain-containing protein [Bacteroidota bacterium]
MKNETRDNEPLGPMTIGGQAVIEGVMMRAPGIIATAVRRADGTITIRREQFEAVSKRVPVLKYPILRGAVGVIEMLVIGIRTLNFSAELAMEDARVDGQKPGSVGEKQSKLMLGVTVAVAFALALALFFVSPLVLTSLFFSVDQNPILFNLFAGGVRLSLFLVYLLAIARMPDVKRLFAYHGAEHKAVFAYEREKELTVASASRQSRFHPRCGTSFLLIVMLAAILIFAILDGLLLQWWGELTLGIRLLTHLPLVPLVGGLSYELIRFSSRHSGSWWGRILIAPGLWMQGITTREPDESQLEVALAALTSALEGSEKRTTATGQSSLAGAA